MEVFKRIVVEKELVEETGKRRMTTDERNKDLSLRQIPSGV